MTFATQLNEFIEHLKSAPESIEFSNVMAFIETHYDYQATDFENGIEPHKVQNAAGTNEGSCKIFAFAKINGLSKEQTLACFGAYYRGDVLKHPAGNDHQNIRSFMLSGWDGISFAKAALTPK